jgi:hypothetical protein
MGIRRAWRLSRRPKRGGARTGAAAGQGEDRAGRARRWWEDPAAGGTFPGMGVLQAADLPAPPWGGRCRAGGCGRGSARGGFNISSCRPRTGTEPIRNTGVAHDDVEQPLPGDSDLFHREADERPLAASSCPSFVIAAFFFLCTPRSSGSALGLPTTSPSSDGSRVPGILYLNVTRQPVG